MAIIVSVPRNNGHHEMIWIPIVSELLVAAIRNRISYGAVCGAVDCNTNVSSLFFNPITKNWQANSKSKIQIRHKK